MNIVTHTKNCIKNGFQKKNKFYYCCTDVYIYNRTPSFLHTYTSLCKVLFQFKVVGRTHRMHSPPIIHGSVVKLKVSARETNAAVILGFEFQNKLTAHSCVEVHYYYANKNYI